MDNVTDVTQDKIISKLKTDAVMNAIEAVDNLAEFTKKGENQQKESVRRAHDSMLKSTAAFFELKAILKAGKEDPWDSDAVKILLPIEAAIAGAYRNGALSDYMPQFGQLPLSPARELESGVFGLERSDMRVSETFKNWGAQQEQLRDIELMRRYFIEEFSVASISHSHYLEPLIQEITARGKS